jgi:C4-dicarboxylate-specific signal transduction histidine kinase
MDGAELEEIQLVGGIFAHILGQVRAQEHLSELREEMVRSSRLALLGELAATMVHEISQPLSAIRSEVGALRLNPGQVAPDVLLALEENASRAGQILANLRGWIRNDACVPAKHAPGLLVEEVVALLSPRMHALSIQIIHRLPADLPMVKVVAVEIRQVLANLLRNAAEAMADQQEGWRVEISARRKGAWVWIKVEDTGPGIPAGMEEKIFSPLFTTRPDGTGMGLAICRRVIAAHGEKSKRAAAGAGEQSSSFRCRWRRNSCQRLPIHLAKGVRRNVPARVVARIITTTPGSGKFWAPTSRAAGMLRTLVPRARTMR